jgi:hypothetical protein
MLTRAAVLGNYVGLSNISHHHSALHDRKEVRMLSACREYYVAANDAQMTSSLFSGCGFLSRKFRSFLMQLLIVKGQ